LSKKLVKKLDKQLKSHAKDDMIKIILSFLIGPLIGPLALGQDALLAQFCKKIEADFKLKNWGKSRCEEVSWEYHRKSLLGDPIMFTIFGDVNEWEKKKFDTTIVLCGVHGDEITPIKFCFDIIHDLLERKNHTEEKEKNKFKDRLIVIAPIVTPDSYFKQKPTRTNAAGVDVNRNFPTKDWWKDALKLWRQNYRQDKRRNPGQKPMTEPEVVFQMNLIKRFRPQKIISVHAPLTLIDYDGPDRDKNDKAAGDHKAKELLVQMSKEAKSYRIKDYPFFPGSLGNWAGNELGIPTYTLELPTSDERKHKEHWELFKSAIYAAFINELPTVAPLDIPQNVDD
jgi:murein peptide amidase A